MNKEKSKEIKRNRKFLKVKTTTNYDKLRLFKGYKSEDFRRFQGYRLQLRTFYIQFMRKYNKYNIRFNS